jgi:hypothetical protein
MDRPGVTGFGYFDAVQETVFTNLPAGQVPQFIGLAIAPAAVTIVHLISSLKPLPLATLLPGLTERGCSFR